MEMTMTRVARVSAQPGCFPEAWLVEVLMTPNWEWWIRWQAVLSFRETWTGCKVGQRGT